MILAPYHFAGVRLQFDPAGALIWPDEHLLVVADLHLEKGTASAARGHLLPPWDTGLTLDRLARLMRLYRPRTVVALGDSFHDTHGAARMGLAEAARLRLLAEQAQFIWVLGNHDPVAQDMPGLWTESWSAGPLQFRHQAATSGGEICGHHHPKASVALRGTHVTRPCFLADGHRILMPAFGTYTGGLDITAPPIAALFPRGGRAFLLGRDRLYSFAVPARRVARARSMPIQPATLV